MKRRGLHQNVLFRAFIFSLAINSWNTPSSIAEEPAVDGAQLDSQGGKTLIQRFLEFTGDKNVMGKAKTGDGKVVLSGNKTRFNGDDGLSFKSDLTYHDYMFKIPDEAARKKNPNDPNAASKELMPGISTHGGIEEGGGSSILERTVYKEHEKYSAKDEDPREQERREKEEGIKYKSIYKISTKEIFDKDAQQQGQGAGGNNAPANGGAAGNNPQQKEKDKVERMEMREDVAAKVAEVGKNSVDTIERSARDKDFENDEETMGNILLYYEAGARAATAWADSTKANLTQRRVFKEVNGGGFQVTLNEETPTCDKWSQEKVNSILNEVRDPNQRKQLQEEIQKMTEKCKKMIATPFASVDPRFQKEENSGQQGGEPQETIKEQGPKKEDPLARDLRNQLGVIEKAGINPNDLPTNWKYEAKDEKSKYSKVDEQGKIIGEEDKKVSEVMEEYNEQLKEGIQSVEEAKKDIPFMEFDADKAASYALKPGETSAANIMKRPVQQALEEEAEVKAQSESSASKNYEELVQKNQE